MREERSMRGDVGAEEAAADGPGTLVVVTPAGNIARTSMWIRQEVEGQELIAIPRLHIEHEASLAITAGMGLGLLFQGSRLVTPDWEDVAGFVGGTWMMWRTGRPELLKAGFVKGKPKFDIEKAVRGIVKLLRG